jgi:RHS repeat-associated protein
MSLSRLIPSLALAALLWPASAGAQGGDEVVYYHTDAIGSVRMTTDASGAVIARYDFRPFGEAWDPPSTADARQYAGKERDSETGLDYFGARYYASQTGRFTTVDPVLNIEAALTDPQRWNRYAYARNNPLVFIDPDGRDLYRGITPWEQALMRIAGGFRDRVSAMGADSTAPQHHWEVFGRNVVDTFLGTFLPRNVEEYANSANAAVLGMAIPLPAITATTKAALLEAAIAEGRGGVSAAGRALQSHASRGGWLADLAQAGNAAANTKVAKGVLQTILARGQTTLEKHPTFGSVFKVRLPDGSGAWWAQNGKFIGFLERYTPR